MGKGQLFSYDILFASVFLVFTLSLFVLTANNISSQIGDAEARMKMGGAAQDAADALVRTPGDPSNWQLQPVDENATRSLGLAMRPGELDPAKVSTFFAIANGSAQYDSTIYLLALTSGSYRYNASIELFNGTVLYSLPRYPPSAPVRTVAVERFAMLNGTVVRFKMVIWDE